MDYSGISSKAERMLLHQAGQQRTPINGSLELLPLCNMNCDMCYVRLSREEMEKQGRLRTADEWLALAEQMREAGVLFLLLTGGEPLIHPEFKRLYQELRKMGMMISVNTNGTLIDEQWADYFAENRPRRINITLYGTDEQTYADLCHYAGGFNRTIEGIRLLRERGIDVKVGNSLTRKNYSERAKIPLIARELNALSHTDTYMFPAERERQKPFLMQSRVSPEEAARARIEMMFAEKTPEQAARAIFDMHNAVVNTPVQNEEQGLMRCMAGKCSFTINWQGEMRPCVMLTEPSIPVFDVGFETAWRQIVSSVERIRLSDTCSQCRLRRICDVCAASALLETGSYDGVPEYMCRYARETYRLLAGFCAHEMKERKSNGGDAK